MGWMRAICCRLKSDYSYTVKDVYNNFPWPQPTDIQRQKIEQAAKAILDARAVGFFAAEPKIFSIPVNKSVFFVEMPQ